MFIHHDPSLTCCLAVLKFIVAIRLDMPCIVRKRGHEREMHLVDEIVSGFGYMCKRGLTFDMEITRQSRLATKRSRSPEACRVKESNFKGQDVSYWNQLATTNSSDVSHLGDALQTRNREYAALFEINTKLLASYRALERKMIDAERELTHLRTNPFRESGAYSSIITTVPVNTQGKDVFHWHQMCRTMETQYLEAKREIDAKTHQFILLTTRIKELESLLSQRPSR